MCEDVSSCWRLGCTLQQDARCTDRNLKPETKSKSFSYWRYASLMGDWLSFCPESCKVSLNASEASKRARVNGSSTSQRVRSLLALSGSSSKRNYVGVLYSNLESKFVILKTTLNVSYVKNKLNNGVFWTRRATYHHARGISFCTSFSWYVP